jgi:hypothetical protein
MARGGGLRIRLIADGGSARHWVVGSIVEATDLLESILAELLATPAGGGRAQAPDPSGGWSPGSERSGGDGAMA